MVDCLVTISAEIICKNIKDDLGQAEQDWKILVSHFSRKYCVLLTLFKSVCEWTINYFLNTHRRILSVEPPRRYGKSPRYPIYVSILWTRCCSPLSLILLHPACWDSSCRQQRVQVRFLCRVKLISPGYLIPTTTKIEITNTLSKALTLTMRVSSPKPLN